MAQPAIVHVNPLEAVRPVMAKADLNELEAWRRQVGAAVARCFALAGLTQKEAAARLAKDPAQVARWIAGLERPHVDLLLSVPELRQPFVLAMCELAGADVEIETVIRVKRGDRCAR